MARTEDRNGTGSHVAPIFYDDTGRRWLWFRLLAILAIAICAFGFLTVVRGSYETQSLPSLNLPYQQQIRAMPILPDLAAADPEAKTVR